MKLTTGRPLTTFLIAAALGVLGTAAHADFQSGLDLFKAGKYVDAAAEFQKLVDQSPEYDYGYYVLGLSFLKLNKIEDAEKNFRRAVELNGDKFEYHHGLANSLMKRRKYGEVVRVLDQAEGLATDNQKKYMIYSMRGFAYSSQKRWSEAIGDLEKARKIKSSNTVVSQLAKAYYALGHNDKAVPLFHERLDANPNDTETLELIARACIKMGRGARDEKSKQKHYRGALDAAQKCKNLRANDADAANLVGKAALGAGDYPRAEQAFREVLSLKPESCFAMINLSKTYIAMEKYKAAEQPLKDAAVCAPRESTIWESLGLVYQKFGKQAQENNEPSNAFAHYDRALKYYDEAKKIKNSSFIAKAVETINGNIEVIEHNMGQDKLAAAQAAAMEAERRRQDEERRKREEWDKKRRRDD